VPENSILLIDTHANKRLYAAQFGSSKDADKNSEEVEVLMLIKTLLLSVGYIGLH